MLPLGNIVIDVKSESKILSLKYHARSIYCFIIINDNGNKMVGNDLSIEIS